jgi:hypothetical protein
MAIITIPTSISGISIPSFGTGGPLESLYQTSGLPFYKYPRDLGSSTRNHSVVFTIKKIKEVPFSDVKEFVLATTKKVGELGTEKITYEGSELDPGGSYTVQVESLISVGTRAATDQLNKSFPAAGATTGIVEKSIDVLGQAGVAAGNIIGNLSRFISTREVENQAIIALYMPETMSFTNDASYDDNTTLAGAAGALPIVGGIVSRVTGALGENAAVRVALNKMGYVFNPQKQMLFQGIEFRKFSMSFTFTPYSTKEAQDVKEIIKLFRKWSAPQKSTLGGGMFFNPPAVFGVDFKFNNSQNVNIPKLKDCVIESVEVNYAPNGMWSAHSDGAPVQTTVTLSLQEMDLVDRTDIENGY